jgi:hypothetical protein
MAQFLQEKNRQKLTEKRSNFEEYSPEKVEQAMCFKIYLRF